MPNLTLYALLSAMEQDMRELVEVQLGPQFEQGEELLGSCYETALERCQADLDTTGAEELASLLPYTDFNDMWEVLNRWRGMLPESIAAHVKTLNKPFAPLAAIRNRVAHSRPLEYSDLPKVMDAVDQTLAGPTELWAELRAVTERLREDPSFVLGIEPPKLEDPIPNNLPEPDFDETGFLGRNEIATKIRDLCLRGGHPVITIFGDGGVGKTSLALKVAYELLDDPDCPFESIVWTSSKTATLSGNDIIEIEGAISDSLGLMSDLADTLSGTSPVEPTEEVMQYLREFRLLLVIDNLETVLDQRLREFLAGVPAGGSKILLTSRIGVGAFEHPVELEPMADEESVRLLRALADARGVPDLVQTNNKRLTRYCRRMKNNPLWIKWFVSGVQTGARPEDMLSQPGKFLDYALTNVYDYLSEASHDLLNVMQTVPGRHSQAQLVFLSEMDLEEVQRALLELARTHMMRIRRSPGGSSFETEYMLGDLARTYLSKHHPVSKQDHSRYRSRHNRLIKAGEDLRARQRRSPFLARSLDMGSSGNLIVARHLLAAFNALKDENLDIAGLEIESAMALAPEWYEVHRVAGNLEAAKGNYPAAEERFEAAVELAPGSTSLRYWYGLFLLTELKEPEAAAEQFKLGLELDRSALPLRLELARALLYTGDFDGAREQLDYSLKNEGELGLYSLKKLHDLDLQHYMRLADQLANEGEHAKALETLGEMRVAFGSCPESCVDQLILRRVRSCRAIVDRVRRYSQDAEILAQAKEIEVWIRTTGRKVPVSTSVDAGGRLSGVVKHLRADKEFGFIHVPGRPDLFFHVSNAPEISTVRELPVGTAVHFEIGEKQGRKQATEVIARAPA